MSLKIKPLNIQKAIDIKEFLDRKQNSNEIEEIPIYQKIYPPLKDLFIFDENNEINNNLLKTKIKISRKHKKANFLEDEEDSEENDEMTENFLNDIVKVPSPIPKNKIINVISKFIQKSKLIEKLESDYKSEKEKGDYSLSELCAENLNYIKLKPGQIVFRIGDIGEKFYFILSGKISILKLKELPDIEMTYIQYIKYCIFLLNLKEYYILNEVIKVNEYILRLSSIEDIKAINKIIFIRTLLEKINKVILNNNHLRIYFQQNNQKFEDYEINNEELEILEQRKLEGKRGSGKEWEFYITKRIKLNISDKIFFQPYENILKDNKPRKFKCFCYHPFLYLGPGLFFGDTALDFENNRRNATIRAEVYSIVAYLNREEYLNIISPKRKMEQSKEIEFIYEKFFFGEINSHIFEKNYFHLFSPREYHRGNILFSQGTIPKSLLLLKSGSISSEFKGSVIDIHNLIKYIYTNIFINPFFSKLPQSYKNRYLPSKKLSIIKSYINDPILSRMKMHNNKFIEEMNLVKSFQMKIITKNEAIGLEEIFLRLPYLTKSIVISEKIFCYELELDHLDKMINNSKDEIHSYILFSINKIISLIERLQNIKQNSINMALDKYEKEIINYKNELNNKNYKTNNEINIERLRKIKLNNSELNITNRNKELYSNSINKEEINSTIYSQNSSPIKLMMTNITPKSKSIFEKMKLTNNKFQKKQYKFRNNEPKTIRNNSLYLYKSFNKTINKSDVDSIKNKNMLQTTELYNKAFSYDSKIKENTQVSYFNKKSNKTPKNFNVDKLGTKDEENNQKEKELIENLNPFDTKINIFNRIPKYNFNFSFIPLNLICQNENLDLEDKNKLFVSNINKLLKLNKRTIDFYNNLGLNNNTNSTYRSIKSDRTQEITKRLKILNNKYQIIKKNKEKERDLDKAINIINKKKIISTLVKNFYKDIKLNGYSPFIHNKEINTYFKKKFNKKYDRIEKDRNFKRSGSLPIIYKY